MTKNSILLTLLLALLTLAGCGGGQVGLSGKVVYSDDQSPLTMGTVCFETEKFLARGNIKPDGTFTVGSIKDTDGLPPGNYRVYVSDARKIIGQDKDGADIYEPLIASKFTTAATSGITIEVTSSQKNYTIEVDRYVSEK